MNEYKQFNLFQEKPDTIQVPDDAEKKCTDCGEIKPLHEYHSSNYKAFGKQPRCKECNWVYGLKRSYGITRNQYEKMMTEQNGECAICGSADSRSVKMKRLLVDHDHDSGQVRSLLCNNCNTGLGFFQDNPLLLRKAISYLKKHK